MGQSVTDSALSTNLRKWVLQTANIVLLWYGILYPTYDMDQSTTSVYTSVYKCATGLHGLVCSVQPCLGCIIYEIGCQT